MSTCFLSNMPCISYSCQYIPVVYNPMVLFLLDILVVFEFYFLFSLYYPVHVRAAGLCVRSRPFVYIICQQKNRLFSALPLENLLLSVICCLLCKFKCLQCGLLHPAGPEQRQKKWWGSLIFIICAQKQNSWNLTSTVLDIKLVVVPCQLNCNCAVPVVVLLSCAALTSQCFDPYPCQIIISGCV